MPVKGTQLFEYYKPKSVLGLGCGVDAYLLAAKQCGITRVTKQPITQILPLTLSDRYAMVLYVDTATLVTPKIVKIVVNTLASDGLCILKKHRKTRIQLFVKAGLYPSCEESKMCTLLAGLPVVALSRQLSEQEKLP